MTNAFFGDAGRPAVGRESADAASAHAVNSPLRHRLVSVLQYGDDIWEVRLDQKTLGYIHLAGIVYVALVGATLDLAVEVGQSLSLARAIELLQAP